MLRFRIKISKSKLPSLIAEARLSRCRASSRGSKKGVNPEPFPNVEVWSGDFTEKCQGRVTVLLHSVVPTNFTQIKSVAFTNTTPTPTVTVTATETNTPTPTQTPTPGLEQKIFVNLSMIRVGNDPAIFTDPWTEANVKLQLGHAIQIWSKANINLRWANQPRFIDISDPGKSPAAPGGDGDITDPKGTDVLEFTALCRAAREAAKEKAYPVAYIQHFVDANGNKADLLSQTLWTKGKTAGCSAISVQAHEAELAVTKKGVTLAHELGHAFCLQEEADSNNLMGPGIPTGQKLTKAQMRIARECAKRLMLPWDVNGDKAVTTVDIFDVAAHFGHQSPNVPWDADQDYLRDVDRDGAITIIDIFAVASHFGQIAKDGT